MKSFREKSREYWEGRAQKQGPSYVGPGGRPTASREEMEAFQSVLRLLVPPDPQCLLDFGCGSGRMTPFLSGRARRYVGADICETALLMAPTGPSIEYVYLRDRIPLSSGVVDVVVATVVFQHITDNEEFMVWGDEIRRVLRPQGRVIVIDNKTLPDPQPHMQPRSPFAVAWALKLRCVFEAHDLLRNHWTGVFTR